MKFSVAAIAATLLASASANAIIPRAADGAIVARTDDKAIVARTDNTETVQIKDFHFHRGPEGWITSLQFIVHFTDGTRRENICKAWDPSHPKDGHFKRFYISSTYYCGKAGKWQLKYAPKHTAPLFQKESKLYLWDSREKPHPIYAGVGVVPGPECHEDDGGKTCHAKEDFYITMVSD